MSWFKNAKTSVKLILSFALVAAITAAVGGFGIVKLGASDSWMDEIFRKGLRAVEFASKAEMDQVYVGRAVRIALLARTPDEARAAQREVTDRLNDIDTTLAEVEKRVTVQEQRDQLAKMRELIPAWRSNIEDCVEYAVAGNHDAGMAALDKANVVAKELGAAFSGLVDATSKHAREINDSSTEVYHQARTTMISILVLAALGALFLGWILSRMIGQPLIEAAKVLENVAAGDFTSRLDIDRKDEVGQMAESLNDAVSKMQKALLEVRTVSDSVAAAATQLASASAEISSGAQEQASGLEESAASIEEITATIKQSADNARQASQLALGSREAAERGGQVVNETIGAMSEINQSSKKIADIITAIDEIAFQTNLLALNAAVEAARAGEQGRGFAVVAAEVRNLAQRSATAAKEIKGLIQDSVRKVETGSDLVNRSGTTLADIVTSVKRVTDIVTEMASAAREQSAGIDQVNKAIAQMDQVTQSNAAQTEEMSGTAQGLTEQAEQLRALVGRFRLTDDGDMTFRATGRAATPVGTSRPKRVTLVRVPTVRAPVSSRRASHGNGHKKGVAAMDQLMAGAAGDDAAFEEA